MRVPLQRPQVAEASPPTRARQRVSRPRGCQIPERRTRVLGLRGRAGGPDARELHPQKSAFGLIRSQPKAVLKGVRGKGKAQGRRKPLERELMAPLGPARNPWRLSYATCTGHIRDTFLERRLPPLGGGGAGATHLARGGIEGEPPAVVFRPEDRRHAGDRAGARRAGLALHHELHEPHEPQKRASLKAARVGVAEAQVSPAAASTALAASPARPARWLRPIPVEFRHWDGAAFHLVRRGNLNKL
jgi:hypothetical protein